MGNRNSSNLRYMLGFIGAISDFLSNVPLPVMGGISMILFGLISYNGFKVLKTKVNWNWQAIVVVVITLYVGLAGVLANFLPWLPVLQIKITDTLTFGGMALAAIIGIIVSYGLTFTEENDKLPEQE